MGMLDRIRTYFRGRGRNTNPAPPARAAAPEPRRAPAPRQAPEPPPPTPDPVPAPVLDYVRNLRVAKENAVNAETARGDAYFSSLDTTEEFPTGRQVLAELGQSSPVLKNNNSLFTRSPVMFCDMWMMSKGYTLDQLTANPPAEVDGVSMREKQAEEGRKMYDYFNDPNISGEAKRAKMAEMFATADAVVRNEPVPNTENDAELIRNFGKISFMRNFSGEACQEFLTEKAVNSVGSYMHDNLPEEKYNGLMDEYFRIQQVSGALYNYVATVNPDTVADNRTDVNEYRSDPARGALASDAANLAALRSLPKQPPGTSVENYTPSFDENQFLRDDISYKSNLGNISSIVLSDRIYQAYGERAANQNQNDIAALAAQHSTSPQAVSPEAIERQKRVMTNARAAGSVADVIAKNANSPDFLAKRVNSMRYAENQQRQEDLRLPAMYEKLVNLNSERSDAEKSFLNAVENLPGRRPKLSAEVKNLHQQLTDEIPTAEGPELFKKDSTVPQSVRAARRGRPGAVPRGRNVADEFAPLLTSTTQSAKPKVHTKNEASSPHTFTEKAPARSNNF